MTLERHAGSWSVAARDFPTNKGGLCRKGWTAASLLTSPERLTTPLIRDRRGMKLRPATWDEALGRVADGMRTIQARHGRDAFAVFGGGGLTNEKAYLLGKFARVALRTANIDYNGRFCMAAAATAGIRAFGLDRGLPFPLEDIPGAEVILLPGGNPAETMPPILQYFEAQKRRGGKLIVADPRRTATARTADLHLQLSPGTDAALANGLLHIAMRDKLIDTVFIGERTSGFEAVRRVCKSYWPDRVERITGVPAKALERAAHMLGEAATAMVLTARGAEQQSHGTDNVLAYINLLLSLGRVGRKHSGYGCLTGQGNGQGGREHGQKADQLPGYREIADPAARAHVAGVWGVPPESLPGPGVSACELFGQFGGGVRGLMVVASNILVSAPDSDVLAGGLGALDMLVVADMFLSETAARADVVLPIAQWAEEDGTMTNLEGRVLRRRKAMERHRKACGPTSKSWQRSQPVSAARPPSTQHPKRRLPNCDVPAAVARPITRASATTGSTPRMAYSGHAPTLPRQARRACSWTGLPPRMAAPAFTRWNIADRPRPPIANSPTRSPTGRLLTHYQSGSQTRRVPELQAAEPACFAEIHADTARTLGVAIGDNVRLSTRRGSIVLPVRITRDIRLDTVFVPFHWGGASSANLLTNAALDPFARIPEFKACAVHVARVGPSTHAAKPHVDALHAARAPEVT